MRCEFGPAKCRAFFCNPAHLLAKYFPAVQNLPFVRLLSVRKVYTMQENTQHQPPALTHAAKLVNTQVQTAKQILIGNRVKDFTARDVVELAKVLLQQEQD